jgi:hypothetical protein
MYCLPKSSTIISGNGSREDDKKLSDIVIVKGECCTDENVVSLDTSVYTFSVITMSSPYIFKDHSLRAKLCLPQTCFFHYIQVDHWFKDTCTYCHHTLHQRCSIHNGVRTHVFSSDNENKSH